MANTQDHELRPSAHPYWITTATSSPARHRTYINLKKANWTGYRQEIERKLSSRHLPTDCQKDEKLFRTTLLKAASHHIPTGRRKLYMQQVPVGILAMMEERDDGSNYLSLHEVELNCLATTYASKSRSTPILTVRCSFKSVSASSQFDAAELIRYMITKPQQRQPDQTHLKLLQMSGDEHLNPGPAIKYPCPVCTRNVTSRGVSYKCTKCYGWVHAKCSGILNAAQYRRKSYWTCDAGSAPQSQ